MATIYKNKDESISEETIDKYIDQSLVKFKLESEMTEPFIRQKITRTYFIAWTEVRIYSEWWNKECQFKDCQPDVILLHNNRKRLFAFELKLYDWRGVLKQAINNSKIFQFSGIVMPSKIIDDYWHMIKPVAEKYNIEVVGMDNDKSLKYFRSANPRKPNKSPVFKNESDIYLKFAYRAKPAVFRYWNDYFLQKVNCDLVRKNDF